MDKDYMIIFKNIKSIQEENDNNIEKYNVSQEIYNIHDKAGVSHNNQQLIKNLHSGQILSLKR